LLITKDHIYVPIGYEVVPGILTLDDLANETIFDAAYEEYVTNHSGILSTPGSSSALLSLEQVLEGAEPHLKSYPEDYNLTAALTAQYALIWDDLFNSTEAVTQELSIDGGMNPVFVNDTTQLFFASTPGNFFTLLGVLEHPFSRGSVHLASADVNVYPTIDPKYLSHPLDLEILSKIALHLQKVAMAEPLRSLLEGNGTVYQPGYYELDEANVGNWIKQNLQSEYHPSGTCAMLPKAKGGVVDSKFKVYGTSGLRVVDASVFPILPRANLQTLVYAIAERAVDFIKEDMWP
jgi:choline dehydrogenase